MRKLQKRRKLKGKTDYKLRLGLLKSSLPRIVVRKTNKYINVQYIKSNEAQDKVEFGVSSKELLKYGWPKSLNGSLKSIPAAYLIGYYAGKKIGDKNKVILDLGIQRKKKGNRLFSVLKGLVDAGIKIMYDKRVFPSNERIKGVHLKEKIDIEKIKQNLENG